MSNEAFANASHTHVIVPGSTFAVDSVSFPNWATAARTLTDPLITNKTGWLDNDTVVPGGRFRGGAVCVRS